MRTYLEEKTVYATGQNPPNLIGPPKGYATPQAWQKRQKRTYQRSGLHDGRAVRVEAHTHAIAYDLRQICAQTTTSFVPIGLNGCARTPHRTIRDRGENEERHCLITFASYTAFSPAILSCLSLSHRYFCTPDVAGPVLPQFLTPLVEMLLLMRGTFWLEGFLLKSKLSEINNFGGSKLATLCQICPGTPKNAVKSGPRSSRRNPARFGKLTFLLLGNGSRLARALVGWLRIRLAQ
ncbi:hypothetical protein DFH09DRAFT_1078623 [Mycena vulgaris]|nr:hypothetical protein DFH09DRAFT_1078623 [Mycena vulgaris]